VAGWATESGWTTTQSYRQQGKVAATVANRGAEHGRCDSGCGGAGGSSGGGGKIGGYWTVLGSSGQVAGQPYMGRKEGEKVG